MTRAIARVVPEKEKCLAGEKVRSVKTLAALKRFCVEYLTTDLGKSLYVERFQEKILEPYFDGVRETLILVSKKNGKSSLLGALGLFVLCSTPDAEIAIVAASREQAAIILRQARGYIRRSSRLRERLLVVEREIRHRTLGGRMVVRAADADTLDGWIGDLALLDEMGRWGSAENYGLLRDGLGPRHGALVGISTAGDDLESPLGKLRQAAWAMPGFTVEGVHKHVTSENFAFFEWSLDDGEDVDDLELVKQANPLKSMTLAELRLRRESATPDWIWRRFACGQWVAGEESAISSEEWSACSRPGLEIPAGTKGVIVGIDLGWKWDTTAFVPIVREHEDAPIQVHTPAILTPPQDGTSLDAEEVFGVCEAMIERWPGLTFVLDPEAGGEQLAQRLDRQGWTVMTHSQKTGSMAQASQLLSEAIAEGKINHPGDPEFDRHILSAAARFYGVGWRFVKQKGKSLPIDGVIALAMAIRVLRATRGTALTPESNVRVPPSTYAF